MTIHEFLEKWHHPNGQEWLDVEGFAIRLQPHLPTDPTGELVFVIECTLCTGGFPRIHESVKSNALKGRTSQVIIEELLDQLHAALSRRLKEINARSPRHPKLGKPVLVVVAGAGFSAGFGLPLTAGLKQLAAKPCSSPRSRLDELHPKAFEEYPLNEYLAKDGKISDFEILLTIWEAYLHQLGQVDKLRERTHRECYRRFIEQICCHLYSLSWDIKTEASHGKQFDELSAWLLAAKDRYDVRFITFNYDVILEMLCKQAGFSFTYRECIDPEVIPIRKLHGSVNWLEFSLGFSEELSSPNGTMDLIYASGERRIYAFPEVNDCPPSYATREMPVLIPPSASKTYRGVYEWIWTFAAQDIMAADKVLIVGYSFPPLDVFAEHHLVRCLKDAGKPVTFILPDGPAQSRVQELLHEVSPTCIPHKWHVEHFWEHIAP
jgi:hypothetical protein